MPFNPISSEELGGVGGTCVLRGCVPKKLFVYGSHYGRKLCLVCDRIVCGFIPGLSRSAGVTAHSFEESEGFGWEFNDTKPTHNWATMKANKNKELERLTGIYMNLLKNSGVDVKIGRGKVRNKRTGHSFRHSLYNHLVC